MFALNIEIDEDIITVRKHNQLMKLLLRTAMTKHRNHTLKKHFEHNANTKPGGGYGYSKRAKQYQVHKARKYGRTQPNVYTGKTRSLVIGASRITATKDRARLIAKGHFPMPQAMRDEIEILTEEEIGAIVQFIGQAYAKAVRLPKWRRKRKRKTRA